MTLQETIYAMKQEAMAKRPPELVAVMEAETQKLVDSGMADRAVSLGQVLPEFCLPDERGRLTRSRDLLAKGPLVISFYRGIW